MPEDIFTYQLVKDDIVRIFWQGRCIMKIGGYRGQKLKSELQNSSEEEIQSKLQRITGNFKRGNER